MHYPRHVGIIPDGNRTWAQERNLDSVEGHMQGVETSKSIIKYIFTQTKIQALTLRGLSTENTQKRSPDEVSYLMEIFMNHTFDEKLNDFLHKEHINYRRIGDPVGLTPSLVEAFHTKMDEHHYPDSDRTLCIAINYGGRNEIIRAIQSYHNDGHSIGDISPEKLEHYLDTQNLPPCDLIIRTKAHRAQRLSGFMTWQAAYAELYFTDKLFPAINTDDISQALERYHDIATYRNFGK